MDFSKKFLDSPLCVLRGHRSKFLNNEVVMFLKIVFIFANSADPDEMLPLAAFHLGLHCLLVSRMKKVKQPDY